MQLIINIRCSSCLEVYLMGQHRIYSLAQSHIKAAECSIKERICHLSQQTIHWLKSSRQRNGHFTASSCLPTYFICGVAYSAHC